MIKKFKEERISLKQIADELGIETYMISDVEQVFTDLVKEYLDKGYRIVSCKNISGKEPSLYFTKDDEKVVGVEIEEKYKRLSKYEDIEVVSVLEVDSLDRNFRNGNEVSSIEFYKMDDKNLYDSIDDYRKIYNKLNELY